MAMSNEKVSNHIPNDLVFSIMSKLPLKSLYRFKCVHKSWAILFENPNFMNIYRKNFILKNHSYYDDTCLLLKHMVLDFESHCVLHLCSGERLNSKVKLDWPPPFQKDDRDINILGSGINGILCLYDEGISSRVVLWNPAIDEFKVIPPSPVESLPHYVICEVQHHGFGYDSIGDDYKVIRYVKFHSYLHYFSSDRKNFPWLNVVYDPLWEIYSLKSNSWKKLDLDITTLHRSPLSVIEQVYMDGVCHWLGGNETYADEAYLVSFDLGNEEFFLTPTPSYTDDSFNFKLVENRLMLFNGSIALISNFLQMADLYISILGEIGAKESWIKLFIVVPFLFLGYPIGTGMNSDILFVKDDEEGFRLDYVYTVHVHYPQP